MSARDWTADLNRMCDDVAADFDSIGVLSMGERCAVALILGLDKLRPRGYTWLDCVNRIEPELLEACIRVQRARG